MYHMYRLTLGCYTFRSCMQNGSYATQPHEAIVQSLPQMLIRRTGNDFLTLDSDSWPNVFAVCCVHSMLWCWAVRTHLSVVRSFICALPTLYTHIVLNLYCEGTAKPSSKSDSVELSIESVAFYYVTALCFRPLCFVIFLSETLKTIQIQIMFNFIWKKNDLSEIIILDLLLHISLSFNKVNVPSSSQRQ